MLWPFSLTALVFCVSAADINKVHIISMNHLDVGYDGIAPEIGFMNNVVNKYFVEYFPRAAKLAKDLKDGGYTETFKYTTHPWLVNMYLDCPPNLVLSGVKLKCPNATEIASFRHAVASGAITWHAGPMNLQMDNVDDWLLQFSLDLSARLDRSLGVTRNMRVLSQRDVPGMTQAVIPSLRKMNISAISVGVNLMTSPPAVPKLFTWKYGELSVMATFHPGGYPNNPGPNPKNPGGISRDDCITYEGLTEALCFAFRTDNSGPPMDVQEILGYYEILRSEFPGAVLLASTLEAFFTAVAPIASTLPVLDKEIGDTWTQGIGTDPRKQAEYRAVERVMKACLKEGSCSFTDPRVYNASRFLAKLPEHTWGLNTVSDTVNWMNSALENAKKESNFVNVTQSWQEQRNFTYLTIDALQNHTVVNRIAEEFDKLAPKRPDLRGYEPVAESSWSNTMSCPGGLAMGIGPQGAITKLIINKVSFASPAFPLSQFVYSTYNEADFDWLGSLYNYRDGLGPGYTKANVTKNAHPESRDWPVVMDEMYVAVASPCSVLVHVRMIEERPTQYYGAPLDVWVNYNATVNGVDVTFQWFDKPPTRLPESLSLAFSVPAMPNYRWQLSKLGQIVDPLNIVLNGSQYVHGIDDNGVFYFDPSSGSGLQITSPDVPLVTLLTSTRPSPSVFPAPMSPIKDAITGVGYNFFNNIWDTNFIFWYPYQAEDAAFKARFNIRAVNNAKWRPYQKVPHVDIL